MIGQTVRVEKRVKTGVDPGNAPIFTWVGADVHDVLLAPADSADLFGHTRSDGAHISWTAYFPKTYKPSLRGARVTIPDYGSCMVVGDPQRFPEDLTPGKHNLVVKLQDVEG